MTAKETFVDVSGLILNSILFSNKQSQFLCFYFPSGRLVHYIDPLSALNLPHYYIFLFLIKNNLTSTFWTRSQYQLDSLLHNTQLAKLVCQLLDMRQFGDNIGLLVIEPKLSNSKKPKLDLESQNFDRKMMHLW